MANLSIRKLLVLVQKRCLRTSTALPRRSQLTKASNFTLQFLINSCELPSESAFSLSEKFQLKEKDHGKLISVINFFKGESFTRAQIAKLIEKCPVLLHCKVEANLKPKLEFLKQNGFVGELLTELIVKNPAVVIKGSLGRYMKPRLELLKSYLKSDDKIVFAVRRYSRLLTFDLKSTMEPNIDFLKKEGVPASFIAKIITLQPRVMIQKHDRVIFAVNAVKKLGLEPSSYIFVDAFKIILSMSESTWKKKMKMMQSLGWSEEEILSAFKKYPLVMSLSGEKLRMSMDFYVNTMKLDPHTIIAYPKILMYAIDSRIRPRYNVLMILESKKLIKEGRKIVWLFTLSEKTFLNKYVIRYEHTIPGLLETYNTGKKAEKIGFDGKEESLLLQDKGTWNSSC